MSINGVFPKLSPEEAALEVSDGAMVAFSGFASAGAAKVVPRAIAARARELHQKGEPFQIRVLTGSSSGDTIDDPLAEADAISWRAPYQSSTVLRKQINKQKVEYVDMHLSGVQRTVLSGFFGKLDLAVIEATDVTPDGRVYLTSSIGSSPSYLRAAERVIIELNRFHSRRLPEMADIVILPPPPYRAPVPVNDPLTRIGYPYAEVDPAKIIGIVESNEPDHVPAFAPPNPCTDRIAGHIVEFLMKEMRAGRIPKEFLPLQAGVGMVPNGVIMALGANPDIPPFNMYTLSVQDALVDFIEQGRLLGASATSITATPGVFSRIYDNMDFFSQHIVLRPQEVSNNAGVIRRLGVISMNTAVEVDIYGNVNSSHVFGTDVVNGVGGSGEFIRNSYLSIVMCPSIARGGRISLVVPMVPHVDNNEHSVQVIVTEQGLADLRGLGPMQRAKLIIENCAHPAYRDYLYRYIERARVGHIRHDLDTCFDLHLNLMEQGAMLPDLDLSTIECISCV